MFAQPVDVCTKYGYLMKYCVSCCFFSVGMSAELVDLTLSSVYQEWEFCLHATWRMHSGAVDKSATPTPTGVLAGLRGMMRLRLCKGFLARRQVF